MGPAKDSAIFWLCIYHKAPHYVVFSTPLLGPNMILSTLFWGTLSLRQSLNVSDQVSHPYKTKGKLILLYILICISLNSKLEDEGSAPDDNKHSRLQSALDFLMNEILNR